MAFKYKAWNLEIEKKNLQRATSRISQRGSKGPGGQSGGHCCEVIEAKNPDTADPRGNSRIGRGPLALARAVPV